MMSKPKLPVTVTLITLNEELDLPRALESVQWAKDIVVVDSGSSDRTVEIAKKYGARVFQNPWEGYGKQKNFAQNQAEFRWILNLDADEVVSDELRKEIEDALLLPVPTHAAFQIPRKTWYLGRWILHGGWYPNHLVRLYNREFCQWSEPNLHESVKVSGNTGRLKSPLLHYTFRDIEDQVLSNVQYARAGALDLETKNKSATLAHLLLKPVGKFLETYLWKRGFLDGLAGLIISVNAAHSMFLKYAFALERKRRENSDRRQ